MEQNFTKKFGFQCYFCNKIIQNESEMGHTAVCQNVLLSCPNNCGAYIARKDFLRHKNECVNRVVKSERRKSLHSLTASYNHLDQMTPNSSSLDRINGSNSNKQVNFNLTNGNYNLENSTSEYENQLKQENFKQQLNSLLDWKSKIDFHLEKLKETMGYFQKSKSNSDSYLLGLQERVKILDQIKFDLTTQKNSFLNEQALNRKIITELTLNLEHLKSNFNMEIANITTVLKGDKKDMEENLEEIKYLKGVAEEQRAKVSNVVFDLRAASQIASETAEKAEIYERENREIKKDLAQLKLDMEILEDLSTQELNSTPGRMMWKIPNLNSKLSQAKENECFLKSPIFYSHQYGYKIRVLMYLNGLNKWKDRYALLCIFVQKGEYDLLLKWPCFIEGKVSLKCLQQSENAKDFTKQIVAKRQHANEENEEPQESSSTYIFIPHNVLFKEKYVKEDTCFIQINIEKR